MQHVDMYVYNIPVLTILEYFVWANGNQTDTAHALYPMYWHKLSSFNAFFVHRFEIEENYMVCLTEELRKHRRGHRVIVSTFFDALLKLCLL